MSENGAPEPTAQDPAAQHDAVSEHGHAPGAVPQPPNTSGDESVPTGGNAAQAAAVFGLHAEPPAEMDSGGAG